MPENNPIPFLHERLIAMMLCASNELVFHWSKSTGIGMYEGNYHDHVYAVIVGLLYCILYCVVVEAGRWK